MLWATSLRCQLKYLRKKCVFNLRLKTDKTFKLRRSVGKLFHNVGAVTLKARSPTDLRAMGWYSLMALSERRRLPTLRGCRRSPRYDRASLCRHLNTIITTLNWIRHSRGSQWSCSSTGVMWWSRGGCVTRRAAFIIYLFCIFCNWFTWADVIAASKELQ